MSSSWRSDRWLKVSRTFSSVASSSGERPSPLGDAASTVRDRRRLQLGRQLVLERGLELRIVLEADAGDETQDGRRTDAGLAGEIGDGLEADHGIVRHQRLSGAPLAGGHQADAVSDAARRRWFLQSSGLLHPTDQGRKRV